ncbi:DUF6491 family protein [Deltaproteobacteria bacterium]|nr:DUF6491 family protein [Deltaproteobacteria bacterium]
MRSIIQTIHVLLVILLISACATGTIKLPEKYIMDNQLELVSHISRYHFMGWDRIDKQSFILQTSPGDYYLIVLQIPADDILFSDSISISSSGSRVQAGLDRVTLLGQTIKHPPYTIERIYRIKGREQVQTIKAQIRE